MTAVDWSVLEVPGLTDKVKASVASVARSHTLGMYTEEDLEQEVLIWCATNAQQVRDLVAREDKLLGLRLWSTARDRLRPEIRHSEMTIGIHRLYEVGE